MKITFLAPGYTWIPSGGIRVVYEYANRLVARGHEVSVVHPRNLSYAPPLQKQGLYGTLRRWANKLHDRFSEPSVNWHQIDGRVRLLYVPNSLVPNIPDADVVFATAWSTVRSVISYPRCKGEKFYLIQHHETWMGPEDLVNETWRSSLHKVVVSKWLIEVGKNLGCDNLAYIPNAIDHGHYRLMKPIRGRPLRIAMAFSKVPFKGAKDGIKALKLAKERHPELEAVLFGATKVRPAIPRWIEYHCNPPQDFIIREIYNGSSIFLCSSWSEGYALPPAEAAACGCAVVATDNGGIRDYIEDGVTGLLSDPKNPELLAANLCRLIEDEDSRVQLAIACKDLLSQSTWDHRADLLEGYISCVLRDPKTFDHNDCVRN